MRAPKDHAFTVIAGLLLAMAVGRRISMLLGCAVAVVFLFALKTPIFPSSELFTFAAALGSCLIVAKAEKNDIKIGFELLELAGILCAAYAMLLQWPGHDPIMITVHGGDFRRVPAFFGQHTLYGPFCVACAAPALFRGRFLKALLIASPIPLIDASFTYLAAGVVIGIYLIFRHGRVAFLTLSLLGAAGAAFTLPVLFSERRVEIEPLNDNGRFALWGIVWQIAKVHPFVGYGFSAFPQQFQFFQSKELREANGVKDESLSPHAREIVARAAELKRRSGIFASAHNEFLQVFYEFGLVGLALIAGLLLVFWFSFLYSPRALEDWILLAVFVSFLANALGNFPFHLIPQALIPLWCFVAMTTRGKRGNLEA